MYGRVIPKEGRGGRVRLREEKICGLTVLSAEVSVGGRREAERRLLRAGEKLRAQGVRQLLEPPDSPFWTVLTRCGLRPVDVGELCRALAAEVTVCALRLRGWEPQRAAVTLSGERAGRHLLRAAERLTERVARVMIDVPGEGRKLAQQLLRRRGLPVLDPGAVRPALTVAFDPGQRVRGAALLLYGPRPQLLGTQIFARGIEVPEDCPAMPLLAALRERGLISDRDLGVMETDGKERELPLDNSF